MTLEESVNELRRVRAECEDLELSDLIGDLVAVYDWVESPPEEEEDAVNKDD